MTAPPRQPLTLAAALDVAIAIEREARDHYLTLARVLADAADDTVKTFFQRMARMEEGHRLELEQRRALSCPDAPRAEVAQFALPRHGPQTEAEAQALTLRRALENALQAEADARSFFLDALEGLADPEVRALFGELAEEEIEHQAMVQAQLDSLARL
jgi:rubrerythrin